MKMLKGLGHEILYRALIGFILFIRFTPYPLAIALARSVCILAWTADSLHRKIANIQLSQALGLEKTMILSLKVFMSQGDILVDAIKYSYMSDTELKARVRIEGREHVEAAMASPRGVMMITGHMNWEILGYIPRILGIEFCIMGDIMKIPGIQAVIEDLRSRCGITLLPPRGGMVSMLTDELKQGRTIGIIIDQRGNEHHKIFCDFFGMPAPTNPAPALIAMKGDALILPVSAVRNGHTYTFTFEKPIDSRQYGNDCRDIEKTSDCWKSQSIVSLSRAMQTWLESAIRKCPQQWFWIHCRWLRRSDMKPILRSKANFGQYVAS
ncbi:MAG: lysophospholipid acyltransferase family protein, partial [Deltaproteobacteria bacterium]|nr:lysophospholipid acyltransferase family protein [Deltaproteobacteria bacterium]